MPCASRSGRSTSRAQRRIRGAFAAIAALLLSSSALAAEATIAWDPGPESTITGYNLYIGSAGQPYPPPIDVGNVSSRTVTGLDPALAYRAAVAAYDELGQESPLSTEVFFTATEPGDQGGGGSPDPVVPDPVPPEDPLLFADDFSDSGRSGDPSWSTVRGAWAGTPQRRYASSGKRIDLTLVAAPGGCDLQAGRIETRVSLTNKDTRAPNAEILFHYQDPAHYRYLRLTPRGLALGQVGWIAGEAPGVKARFARRLAVGRWQYVRLDIEGGTLVTVSLNGAETPAIAFPFAVAAAGGVGLKARSARSLFDDAAIWSDLVLR